MFFLAYFAAVCVNKSQNSKETGEILWPAVGGVQGLSDSDLGFEKTPLVEFKLQERLDPTNATDKSQKRY